MEWYELITSLDFWIQLLEQVKALGPLVPVLLTLIEAFIPALPLIAIVLFNVTVYGEAAGFFYSWLGTTIGSFIVFTLSRLYLKKWFYPHMIKHKSMKRILNWILSTNYVQLFLLTCVAFTPSSLINIGYGLSDFSKRTFYKTLFFSKMVMILVLALFGSGLAKAQENPFYLLLSSAILILLVYLSGKIKKHTRFDDIFK